MSKNENRLKKLETQLQSTALRIVWVNRDEDGDAKIAELIASGHAKAGDEFMLVSWDWEGVAGAPKGKRNRGRTKSLRFGRSSNHPSIETSAMGSSPIALQRLSSKTTPGRTPKMRRGNVWGNGLRPRAPLLVKIP